MPEIRHQQPNASPEISLAEIHIPDDADLGTGTFTTNLRPNSLTPTKVINSTMSNPPAFQISVTINPNRDVAVLLGRTDPVAQSMFLLPDQVDTTVAHIIRVTFAHWSITGAFLDGQFLWPSLTAPPSAN